MDNVSQFPPRDGAPEFMIGPFTENRVVIDGRLIPKMTAWREGDKIWICLDNRLSTHFPSEWGWNAAWLAATAMAIGAGYPCITAESKDRPFAPQCSEIKLDN